jgi:hypothetical protein
LVANRQAPDRLVANRQAPDRLVANRLASVRLGGWFAAGGVATGGLCIAFWRHLDRLGSSGALN